MAGHNRLRGDHPDLALFAVDRALPVALGTQLRGLVAFGIGLGTLRPGDRLPSVRDLADHLGLAPMTVSQVYADMTRDGLLLSRKGAGTFVAAMAATSDGPAAPDGDMALHRSIDALLGQGRALGLRPSDLVGLIAARAGTAGRARRAVLVGHFASTTAAYCTDALRLLGRDGDGLAVEPLTLGALRADERARRLAAASDLVITLPHRRSEVAALLPRTAVAAVTFIPATETRGRLAALDPGARVAVVSVFPEFAPIIKNGVRRFAPHVAEPVVVLHDAPERDRELEAADVVVFATGADDLGLSLPPGVPAFEFRHTPDPTAMRRLLLPLLRPAPDGSPDCGSPVGERELETVR